MSEAQPPVEVPVSGEAEPAGGLVAALGRLGQRLDDLMNPIAVKEMRQAVAGKMIVGVVILFLLVQTVVVAFYMLDDSVVGQQGTSFGDGPGLFLIVMMILLGTCILFVPATTAYRLGAERGDEHVDLMYITTLQPWRIITGKFASAAVVTLLIHALCLPYITLAYLLRGIDLISIATVLGINLLVIGWCVMMAIFSACLPMSKAVRMGVWLLLLGVYVFTFFTSIQMAWQAVEGWLWRDMEWVLVFGGVYVAMTLLLFALATAAISPAASNRAMLPRAVFVVVWVAMGFSLSTMPTDGVEIWAWLSVVALSFSLFAAVGERDRLNPRLAAKVPRNLVLRVQAFFFFSGAANGILWTLGLMVITLVIAYSAFGGLDAQRLEAWAWLCMAYSLAGILVARRSPVARWIAPQHTFVVVLILVTLGAIWPVMGAVLQGNLYIDRIPHGWWVTSVFSAWGDRAQVESTVVMARFAVAVMFLVSAPWLWRQMVSFRPPPSEAPADAAEQSEDRAEPAPAVSEEAERG